jgi:hypothetical protein
MSDNQLYCADMYKVSRKRLTKIILNTHTYERYTFDLNRDSFTNNFVKCNSQYYQIINVAKICVTNCS